MNFVWSDLIDRARTYVDDDHNEQKGALLTPAKWMTLGQIEYAQLYRKWVRLGLVRPKPTDTTFTAASTTINGALAIVGVGEVQGNGVRLLVPSQLTKGPDAIWLGSTPPSEKAWEWAAHGTADNLLIELNPPDTGTQYTVRWIPTVAYATDSSTTIDLPYGGDEVLVLGMARRALVKESAVSRQLEDLKREADAEMTFTAAARVAGGFKARRSLPQERMLPKQFPTDSRFWLYL